MNMKWKGALLAAAMPLVILAGVREPCYAGGLSAYASCDDSSHISFHWSFYENPQNPVGHPEWVGYDVQRRSLGECGQFVTVNAEPFPRVPGKTHSHTYTEVAPASGTTFEYRVILVDANRQRVSLDTFSCDPPCSGEGWASCPQFSAPLTHGALEDWGWALYVHACTGGCYRSFYFDNGPMADKLRPYSGTGTAVRLYGSGACGTVEGCAMQVDHYEIAPCGVVSALPTSWGRLKVVYR